VILDTNAISAWALNDVGLLGMLRGDRPWYLPSIALGEFRYGVLKSTKRAELEAWLEQVETACQVLAPDATTARHYAELRLDTGAARSQIPYHDLWIAAIARQHGLAVVTRDGHFDRIPGVERIGW
jgi:predicted nucleic acid-binding protein